MNSEAGWKNWFMGNLAVSVAWSPRNLISVPSKYSSSVLIWLNFVPWAQFTTWVTPFLFNSSLFLAIKLGGRIFSNLRCGTTFVKKYSGKMWIVMNVKWCNYTYYMHYFKIVILSGLGGGIGTPHLNLKKKLPYILYHCEGLYNDKVYRVKNVFFKFRWGVPI